ncbi:MAG: sugar transferase, partial [Bacteroidales bacterium]
MYLRYFKRVLDVVIAFILLILCLPIFLCTPIISIFFHGPKVLFIQERVGYQGKLFKLIKFRTMTNKRGADGKFLPDKVRETRFGAYMRKISLDELPQLLNVIIGDMSLVGPRPLMPKYVSHCTPLQQKRHDIHPGMTGLAQICGRNTLTYTQRFRYDVWYVHNVSFNLDVKV